MDNLLFMTQSQLTLHILYRATHLLHQHQQVVNHIRCLVYKAVTVAIHSLHNALYSLLANLLSNFLHTLNKEFCGI